MKAAGQTREKQSSVQGEVGWLEGQQGWRRTSSLALHRGQVMAGVCGRPAPCPGTPGGVRALGHPLTQSPGDSHPCTAHWSPWELQGRGFPRLSFSPVSSSSEAAATGGREGKGKGGKRRAGRAPSLSPHTIISWAGGQSCCQAADIQPGCRHAGPRVKCMLQDRV